MFVGLGIGVGFQRVSGGGAAFDSDYQAVLTYAISLGYTLPSSAQQIKQNQLMLDLKAGGIWSKLDTFAMFANDGSSNFALIDWKRLSLYTAVNSPTFTSNVGFQGNGTSSYINSNYFPITNAVNISQNSNSYGYVLSNLGLNISSGQQHFGNAQNTSSQSFWRRYISANNYHNGTSVISSIAKVNTLGVITQMDRTNNSTVYDIVNGNVTNTLSLTSAAILNQQFYCLIYPSTPNYSDAQIQMVFAGASLYNERGDFNNIIKTYLTSL